jgi:peptide chain release factor subunit 1
MEAPMAGRDAGQAGNDVLVLTPVKDASRFAEGYAAGLERMSYPRERLSLGILEGDSGDGTLEAFEALRPRLAKRCRNVSILKRDYGFAMPAGVPRWSPAYQLQRRTILARSRNYLLARVLDQEDWVLWLDADVIDYPGDLIERLLAVGRDIVHPHCVIRRGGSTFDRNAWRDQGRTQMDTLRGSPGPVRLDAVGGTVLLVRADLHREGLVFPPYRYGVESRYIRKPHPLWGEGEIETEGLGMMAKDMGHECWGLPDLEVVHADG